MATFISKTGGLVLLVIALLFGTGVLKLPVNPNISQTDSTTNHAANETSAKQIYLNNLGKNQSQTSEQNAAPAIKQTPAPATTLSKIDVTFICQDTNSDGSINIAVKLNGAPADSFYSVDGLGINPSQKYRPDYAAPGKWSPGPIAPLTVHVYDRSGQRVDISSAPSCK